jgi:hypothetical protein
MRCFPGLHICVVAMVAIAPAHAADPPSSLSPSTNPPAATTTSATPASTTSPSPTAPASGATDVSLPAGAASQLVGLFMQSCVRFALDPNGVREWATHAGLKPLPPEGQQAFLYGLPGQVFDASTKDGKLVMISENSGACSALAESASGATVVTVLEQVMQMAHIDLAMTHEDDDKTEKVLHHREYTAARDGRQWEMLVSTVKGAAPGEVMLTTSP